MDFKELQALAMERLNTAGKILETTYELVHEPKLFLSVIENIYDAFDITMNGMLDANNISYDPNNYAKKIELFDKLHGNSKATALIASVRHTIDNHKDASVEFIRNDQFIISDNDYNMTALSAENVKKTLDDAIECINAIYG